MSTDYVLKTVYNCTEGRLCTEQMQCEKDITHADNNTPPKRLRTSARSLDKFACVAHATVPVTIRKIPKHLRSMSRNCWRP